MNKKNLFLLSIFALSIMSIRPEETIITSEIINTVQVETEETVVSPTQVEAIVLTEEERCFYMHVTTIISGGAIGAFTGGVISNLTNTIFDACMNEYVIELIDSNLKTDQQKLIFKVILSFTKLGAKIGTKWYWEKPVRHKITNWIMANFDKYGIAYDAEFMKTMSRITSWVTTAAGMAADTKKKTIAQLAISLQQTTGTQQQNSAI